MVTRIHQPLGNNNSTLIKPKAKSLYYIIERTHHYEIRQKTYERCP